MKKIVIAIFVLTLTLPAVANAGPRIELNTRVRDIGPVKQGKRISFDFTLTNVGDEDVIIEKLQPN